MVDENNGIALSTFYIIKKFSVKGFFNKYENICKKLQISSHLLKKTFNQKLYFFFVLFCFS